MKKSEIKNSAELFYYKATVDFAAAKTLLEAVEKSEMEIDLEVVFSHLQQTAEKLLKSLLSHKKIRIDKTHDIENITAHCLQNQIELLNGIEILNSLSEFAVEGRYVVLHDDVLDTQKYIAFLENLIVFVKKSIAH